MFLSVLVSSDTTMVVRQNRILQRAEFLGLLVTVLLSKRVSSNAIAVVGQNTMLLPNVHLDSRLHYLLLQYFCPPTSYSLSYWNNSDHQKVTISYWKISVHQQGRFC